MQVQTPEQFLFLEKSRFATKKFFNIDTVRIKITWSNSNVSSFIERRRHFLSSCKKIKWLFWPHLFFSSHWECQSHVRSLFASQVPLRRNWQTNISLNLVLRYLFVYTISNFAQKWQTALVQCDQIWGNFDIF